MNDDFKNLQKALRLAYPDSGKLKFRNRDGKYYVTFKTDVLDPTKEMKDFELTLRNEAKKSGWTVGMTSSLSSDGLRDATFRINYKRNF